MLRCVVATLKFLQTWQDSLRPTNNPEVFLLVGNSGCVKSTLIHYVAADASKIESLEPADGKAINFAVKDHYDTDAADVSSTVSRTNVPELVNDDSGHTWCIHEH